jgi:hypothetical protein
MNEKLTLYTTMAGVLDGVALVQTNNLLLGFTPGLLTELSVYPPPDDLLKIMNPPDRLGIAVETNSSSSPDGD